MNIRLLRLIMRINKALITGYVSQALNVIYGVLLIPVMLMTLNELEVSMWMMLLAIVGLTSVFDFGFSPTIIRVVAYANSGAKKLFKDGVDTLGLEDSAPNLKLLKMIFLASKKIYLLITLVALLIIGVGGTFYFYFFLDGQFSSIYLFTWLFFVIGLLLNVYYLYVNAFLTGLGEIFESNVIQILNKSIRLIASIAGLFVFENILVLAISYLLAIIIGRIYSVMVMKRYVKVWSRELVTKEEVKNVLSSMIPNSWRQGVVVLGGFLINKSTVLIVGLFMSAKASASFAITMHVLEVIIAFSQVYFNIHVAKFSSLYVENNLRDQKYLFYRLSYKTLILYFILSLFVLFFGNQVLGIIGKEVLLSSFLLSLVLIFGLLELNTSITAYFISIGNKVPFVFPAIISGFFIVFLTLLSMFFFSPSLLFPILIQGMVQLSYNHWKWVLVVRGYFKKGYYEF